jgi:hypothetical protein
MLGRPVVKPATVDQAGFSGVSFESRGPYLYGQTTRGGSMASTNIAQGSLRVSRHRPIEIPPITSGRYELHHFIEHITVHPTTATLAY